MMASDVRVGRVLRHKKTGSKVKVMRLVLDQKHYRVRVKHLSSGSVSNVLMFNLVHRYEVEEET